MPGTIRGAGLLGKNGRVSRKGMTKLSRATTLCIFSLVAFLHICANTESVWSATGSSLTSPSGGGKRKLLLFTKNPSNWSTVKNGAHGTLVFREATGNFTLTATGLMPRSSYALVRYADAPPNGDIVARGQSNELGTLELNGIWKNWTKKFWVVAGDDVTGSVGSSGTLTAWRPDRYLFEEKPLGIVCNCPEPEEP